MQPKSIVAGFERAFDHDRCARMRLHVALITPEDADQGLHIAPSPLRWDTLLEIGS